MVEKKAYMFDLSFWATLEKRQRNMTDTVKET